MSQDLSLDAATTAVSAAASAAAAAAAAAAAVGAVVVAALAGRKGPRSRQEVHDSHDEMGASCSVPLGGRRSAAKDWRAAPPRGEEALEHGHDSSAGLTRPTPARRKGRGGGLLSHAESTLVFRYHKNTSALEYYEPVRFLASGSIAAIHLVRRREARVDVPYWERSDLMKHAAPSVAAAAAAAARAASASASLPTTGAGAVFGAAAAASAGGTDTEAESAEDDDNDDDNDDNDDELHSDEDDSDSKDDPSNPAASTRKKQNPKKKKTLEKGASMRRNLTRPERRRPPTHHQHDHNQPQETLYALKSIKKEFAGNMTFFQEIHSEIHTMKGLDHPNIARVYEGFEKKKRVYLVMEYCSGGTLWDNPPKTELDVAKVMRQVLSAVSYMHKKHVVHRDLKLENVVHERPTVYPNHANTSLSYTPVVKIIDFGLAVRYVPGESEPLTERMGSIYTMAPDVIKGRYTNMCDIWSVGVILYTLLSGGKMPFNAKTVKDTMAKIVKRDCSFDDSIWGNVSIDAKHFVDSLLVVDPTLRPTADKALADSIWLNKMAAEIGSGTTMVAPTSAHTPAQAPTPARAPATATVLAPTVVALPPPSLRNKPSYSSSTKTTPTYNSPTLATNEPKSNTKQNQAKTLQQQQQQQQQQDKKESQPQPPLSPSRLGQERAQPQTQTQEQPLNKAKNINNHATAARNVNNVNNNNNNNNNNDDNDTNRVEPSEIQRRLVKFGSTSKLKQYALLLMAHRATPEELVSLRRTFESYDADGDGMITYDDFRSALLTAGNVTGQKNNGDDDHDDHDVNDKDKDKDKSNNEHQDKEEREEQDRLIRHLFDGLDIKRGGMVHYTEFLAATLEARGRIETVRLRETFNHFDDDNTGVISKENVRRMLTATVPSLEDASAVSAAVVAAPPLLPVSAEGGPGEFDNDGVNANSNSSAAAGATVSVVVVDQDKSRCNGKSRSSKTAAIGAVNEVKNGGTGSGGGGVSNPDKDKKKLMPKDSDIDKIFSELRLKEEGEVTYEEFVAMFRDSDRDDVTGDLTASKGGGSSSSSSSSSSNRRRRREDKCERKD